MPPEATWKAVTTAPNHLMAEIVRGSLEAAGIPVMLAGESYATTYGLSDTVEVMVPAERLAEAEAVLAEGAELLPGDAGEEEDESQTTNDEG